MKKYAKLGLGLATVAAIAGVSAFVALAWGPERATYTMAHPADHVVFNSITDNNKEIGDERYFVSASEYTGNAANNKWTDNTAAEDGKEYVVRMYVHNNAASNLKLTAENTRAYVVLPTNTAKSITVNGKISASNANPTTVWDQTTFTSKNGEEFNLAYVPGTAKYYNTKDGKERSFKLDTASNDLFTSTGVLLGYDQMDGKIPGCSEYSGYLTFHVKAQFAAKPNLEISKEVKILGTDNWSEQVEAKAGDTVRYRIHFVNTGNTTMQNVVIRDILPTGLNYVNGTTQIFNTAHPKGVTLSDKIVTDSGINIGDYAAQGGAWIYFNATVDKSVSDKCNNSLLRNVVQANGGSGTKEDTADVLVDGKVCTSGFELDKKVQLKGGSSWSETVKATAGSEIRYRIAFKNTGNTTLENVVLRDTLPAGVSYQAGTTMLGDKKLADGIISANGINIGSVEAGKTVYVYFYATVDKNLDECEAHTLTNVVKGSYNNDDKTTKTDTAVVTIDGKDCSEVDHPGFSIDKMVQLEGGKTWSETVTAKAGDKVRYRIQFKNTGNVTLKNVIIRDVLPTNMSYVAGTTVLYNAANANGKTLDDGLVSKDGINIGDYAKGTEATIYFYAVVDKNLDECANRTLTNTVKGSYNKDDKTTKTDTADVTVDGKVCTPENTPRELPKTGATSIVSGAIGLASMATAAAYYIASRKK
ncbi:DUF11 domain-containing protein [Candidatus Saccharibacteria bacterium]|nr:DUF11 domain-containing protein [Candidatus Saccharibacteria bacterium]